MNTSGSRFQKVLADSDGMDSDITRDKFWALTIAAIPLQPSRHNWGLFVNELLYEASTDEAYGYANRRVLWRGDRQHVWAAKRKICLHNVWCEA